GVYRKSRAHLACDMLPHWLRQPVVSKDKIQEITAVYIFQHQVCTNRVSVSALLPTHPKIGKKKHLQKSLPLASGTNFSRRRQIFGWLSSSKILTSLARLAK